VPAGSAAHAASRVDSANDRHDPDPDLPMVTVRVDRDQHARKRPKRRQQTQRTDWRAVISTQRS
jgi:hypothetical protein